MPVYVSGDSVLVPSSVGCGIAPRSTPAARPQGAAILKVAFWLTVSERLPYDDGTHKNLPKS